MSSFTLFLLAFSLAGLFVLLTCRLLSGGRLRTWLRGSGLLAAIFLLGVGFVWRQPQVVVKGAQDFHLVAALYVSMVLGMGAHYLFRFLSETNNRRKRFRWGAFVAPFFVSPIVFIPIFSAFQGAKFDLDQHAMARLSLLFVAFQNGFFWKEFFDNQRARLNQKDNQ